MEDKIEQVKIEFNKIKDIRNNVTFCFNALETKLTKLKDTTNEFIKNNRNNIFVFGLDSFQFQSKLIDYEYNDMKNFYLALNNRMYCEYYKLYKIILKYAEDVIGTNKSIEMLKSTNIFPIYKDLEPLKQYNFDTIEEIHKTIILLLNTLNEHILFKETQLQLFQKKQKSGLNINNFVKTFDFDVIVIKHKCILFLSYLDFFHIIHTKHFKRFSKKMILINDYLDEDIKFDEELQHIEDNSLKSSISISSLDSNEDIVEENQHINTDKSSIRSNVTNVINTLKITKPNNNIENHLSPIKNINNMLDSLSKSFDDDINDISNRISDTIYANNFKKMDSNDTIIRTINDVVTNQSKPVIETINDVVVNQTTSVIETIYDVTANQTTSVIDTIIEHINAENNGIKIDTTIENSDIINGHDFVKDIFINDSVKTDIDLKQIVDIFNSQDDPEEDTEVTDDPDKGDTDKGDPTSSNKKKKNKKKKK
jgi:hypothetical protein